MDNSHKGRSFHCYFTCYRGEEPEWGQTILAMVTWVRMADNIKSKSWWGDIRDNFVILH